MPIIPARLRELRKRKKLSRPELAEKSKISLRQLARLESDSASSGAAPRERTVNQLAEALDVEPAILLGELPLPEPTAQSRAGTGERIQVSALLWPEVRLAYALIKRRYGVNPTTLFNAAPLMFVLLAEGSFLWRREKLKEIEEAADQLHNLGFGHLSFAFAAYRAQEGASDEEDSIRKSDLFGIDVGQDAFDLGYDRSTNNPFADYLRELARKIDAPDVIDVDASELAHAALENFPFFKVCAGDLEKVSGGSAKASYALERGHVRITDIPDELWTDDAADQRAKWLENQIPESERGIFDLDLDLSTLLDSAKPDGEEASQ
tara:strand:- start:2846 stop:3808 length:963 start_codon:yes stop_codon:yes gene_type:complete